MQKIAWVCAGLFISFGVLGFLPFSTASGMLFGIVAVDAGQNVIHLITGLVGVLVASLSLKHSKLYYQAFGVIYGFIALIGFTTGDTVFGFITTNLYGHLLHGLISVGLLYVGFGMKGESIGMPGVSSNMGCGMGDRM